MKVLIVYASAGAGHRKAAEAVYEYLQETRPDTETKLIDILDYTSPVFKFFYSKGYIFTISKLPWLWYILFRASFVWPSNFLRVYSDYLNSLPFINLVKTENPQFIVSTHFITSGILSIYKNMNLGNHKLITIITDYSLHPFWIGKGVDIYVVACVGVQRALVKRDVEKDKILVRGIPVNYKFYLRSDRKNTAKKLGIESSIFTVLVITGTIGIGPIEQIVKALVGEVQMLVVCGRNKRLYNRLIRLKLSQVKVYPLVDNVDELMSVSDLVLTKAGGLTITECLVKKLPIVFFSNIPGLETANANVICRYKGAFNVESVRKVRDLVIYLKDNPATYRRISDNVARIRKLNTLPDISSEISTSCTPL